MNPQASITIQVVDALEKSDAAYMLVGSFSSNFYGVPRSTKDADFVVQFQNKIGPEFIRLLGDDFEAEAQLSFETNTGTYKQEIRHKQKSFKIEIFILSADAHDQARFARKRQVELFDRKIWLPSPEDVVVTKLRWARGKDYDDIREVMSVQRGKLDWNYIEEWCKRLGKSAKLEELRRTIPGI